MLEQDDHRERQRYFTQKDLWPKIENLLPPGCSWQQMVDQRKVLPRGVLVRVLNEALDFLTTEPGPNLRRRKKIVPPWVNYWKMVLWGYSFPDEVDRFGFVRTRKLRAFDEVGPYLRDWHLADRAGVLFVGGGEGHAGHVHAAEYMAKQWAGGGPLCVLWAFEHDSYFARKARGAPCLPLEVRLSMWHYSVVNLITVSPENTEGLPDAEHYQDLFNRLGARYCFADEDDPYCQQKINRGAQDIDTIIPHYQTARTTDRVRKLFPFVSARKRPPYFSPLEDPFFHLPELLVNGLIFEI